MRILASTTATSWPPATTRGETRKPYLVRWRSVPRTPPPPSDQPGPLPRRIKQVTSHNRNTWNTFLANNKYFIILLYLYLLVIWRAEAGDDPLLTSQALAELTICQKTTWEMWLTLIYSQRLGNIGQIVLTLSVINLIQIDKLLSHVITYYTVKWQPVSLQLLRDNNGLFVPTSPVSHCHIMNYNLESQRKGGGRRDPWSFDWSPWLVDVARYNDDSRPLTRDVGDNFYLFTCQVMI